MKRLQQWMMEDGATKSNVKWKIENVKLLRVIKNTLIRVDLCDPWPLQRSCENEKMRK